MNKYCLDTDQIAVANAELEHIHTKLQRISNSINSAYALLEKQEHGRIARARNVIRNIGPNLDRQLDNVVAIQNFFQELINESATTIHQVQEILKQEKEEASSKPSTGGTGGNSSTNVGSSGQVNTGDKRVEYARKYYYNLDLNLPYEQKQSACALSTTTMILNALGFEDTPEVVYQKNANSVYMQWDNIERGYNVHSELYKLTGMSGEQKRNKIVQLLQSNPQGVLLWNNAANHAIYAYLNSAGNIVINDPGKATGNGISIYSAWKFGDWSNVGSIRTINRN